MLRLMKSTAPSATLLIRIMVGAVFTSEGAQNRQERLDKTPQRIWKQRGGHTCSRYLADEDHFREFCYTLQGRGRRSGELCCDRGNRDREVSLMSLRIGCRPCVPAFPDGTRAAWRACR